MDVLMLGTLIPNKMQDYFAKNNISPQPADIPQKYILKGLSENDEIKNITAICSPRIYSEKKTGVKIVESTDFLYERANVHVVGYKNGDITGLLNRSHNFVVFCKKWAKQNASSKMVILIYSLNSTMLKAALEIKKINRNSVICVIVADLPCYMSSYHGIKLMMKKLDMAIIEKLRRSVDKYVLYTSSMAEYLGLQTGQWIVSEGFIDTDKVVLKKQNHKRIGKRICVYGGSLSPQYGIQKMINAFNKVDDCELHVYGNQNEAKEFSYNDNAKYCGQVSPDKMFEIFCNSDFLINPRPSDLELTKYSFPSKTFEYMAACTPVVMAKLPGITKRFLRYLNYFESETEEGIAKTMNELIGMPYETLQKKAEEGALFLVNDMNNLAQVNRILDFCIS